MCPPNPNQPFHCSSQIQAQSKTLSTELKRNKAAAGDDIFTQRNLDAVTRYLQSMEALPAS
jgi:thiol-disulfide isomerase/thioredoxin